MPIVTIQPEGRQIAIESGHTLLEAARKLSIAGVSSVEAPCGGLGLCGGCRIRITGGHLEPPTAAERKSLPAEALAAGCRLACQAVALGAVAMEIPSESMTCEMELQLSGTEVSVLPDPLVKRYEIGLEASTIAKPSSCWQQIEQALMRDHGYKALKTDFGLIQGRDPMARASSVTVSVSGTEVTNLCVHGTARRLPGLAVDLGSTKVAGYLVDLETGEILAADGIMNPQVPYGADIVSRLAYASGGPEQTALISRITRECIRYLAEVLTGRQGFERADIEQAVVVGNTAMQHLLLKWPVAQLGKAPYMPASKAPLEIKARELGLGFAPGALAYFVPPIAGFIGGDHTAMILASRIHQTDAITLGLDIGTNTELVLACRGRLYSCSCASGPAFEGANLHHGVRAVKGAIRQVRIDDKGQVRCQTIAGKPALGLCGSGAVDALAQLVKKKIVNRFGMLNRNQSLVQLQGQEEEPAFLLVPAQKSATGRAVTLSQGDIGALQLAKAAIAAGTACLLSAAGVHMEQIEKVIIAGAFGNHLDIESAVTIGLLPDLPRERFIQVGNAAGTGARLALISAAERRQAEELAFRVNYLELAASTDFGKHFSGAVNFHYSQPFEDRCQ